jgi:hypothetical protein
MTSSKKPDGINWSALLANTKVVDLKAVRDMEKAHRALFEFEGPPVIGQFVMLFRLTGLFGFFAMSEKRFPVLNRAWADLQWILDNPEADEFSVASWAFLDLPVTEDGRTVVEVFGAEIGPNHADVQKFVEVARLSRYGMYVDDGGTGRTHRLVEMFTKKRQTITRGVPADPGELFWTRIIDWGGMRFMLGDTRGFPAPNLHKVKDMIKVRLADPLWSTPGATTADAYERFMKLAGPYWFSILYSDDDDDPVLQPDHYLAYGHGPVPELDTMRPTSTHTIQ